MKKQEYRELWNILNTRKEALCDEIAQIEDVMGWVEKRGGLEKSIKLF